MRKKIFVYVMINIMKLYQKIFVGIDDATSQLSMIPDGPLNKIVTCSRHCRITTYRVGRKKPQGSNLIPSPSPDLAIIMMDVW